jgi:hypothetical protein
LVYGQSDNRAKWKLPHLTTLTMRILTPASGQYFRL